MGQINTTLMWYRCLDAFFLDDYESVRPFALDNQTLDGGE